MKVGRLGYLVQKVRPEMNKQSAPIAPRDAHIVVQIQHVEISPLLLQREGQLGQLPVLERGASDVAADPAQHNVLAIRTDVVRHVGRVVRDGGPEGAAAVRRVALVLKDPLGDVEVGVGLLHPALAGYQLLHLGRLLPLPRQDGQPRPVDEVGVESLPARLEQRHQPVQPAVVGGLALLHLAVRRGEVGGNHRHKFGLGVGRHLLQRRPAAGADRDGGRIRGQGRVVLLELGLADSGSIGT
mmetsp:Transcript_7052/g.16892  ORF Transcript_7052/g.16892 Transcript_7052/m.16892 type:complete len:241 (+) Transcript_7052:145-867(+)